jgi:hypothetical protein
VTRAFSGTAPGLLGGAGSAEADVDVLRTAPPITADIDAASKDRRDIEPCPAVTSPQLQLTR